MRTGCGPGQQQPQALARMLARYGSRDGRYGQAVGSVPARLFNDVEILTVYAADIAGISGLFTRERETNQTGHANHSPYDIRIALAVGIDNHGSRQLATRITDGAGIHRKIESPRPGGG